MAGILFHASVADLAGLSLNLLPLEKVTTWFFCVNEGPDRGVGLWRCRYPQNDTSIQSNGRGPVDNSRVKGRSEYITLGPPD